MKKRAGRPARFTMIANSAIDDDSLNMTQLGLHTFLVRCKDGYNIDMDALAKRRGPGRRAMYSAMRGLVERGYVVKVKFQDAGGKWATEVAVYDTPAERKEVADLLEEFATCKAIRVEPLWLDPRASGAFELPSDAAPQPPENNTLQSHPRHGCPVGNQRVKENSRSKPTERNRQAGDELDLDEPDCHNRPVGDRQAGDRQADNRLANNLETKTKTKNLPSLPSTFQVGEGGRTASSLPPVQLERIPRTEGVRFLQTLGTHNPRLMITGKALKDQGLIIDELFCRGWTDEVLWELLTRPLPQPLHKDVSAILAKRLSDALISPAPRPRQAGEDAPTPTARRYATGEDVVVRHRYECEGNNGLCGRWVEAEGDLCPSCARMP